MRVTNDYVVYMLWLVNLLRKDSYSWVVMELLVGVKYVVKALTFELGLGLKKYKTSSLELGYLQTWKY